jgi:hypothetical protein
VKVNFTIEEAIAGDQIEYTLDGGAHRHRFDIGDLRTSVAARYQEHTIEIDEEYNKFKIQQQVNGTVKLRFNIRRATDDPVTLIFCRIYRPHDITVIQ